MDDRQLFDAAKSGNVDSLIAAFGRDPARLHARDRPYEWTLLHHAAFKGHLPVVNLLLDRGFDVNAKEQGDHTTALNWAAAAGHVEVVRRLLEAGVDPIGSGDDHELEAIGWATCWDGCDDAAHRAIAGLLIARGARHHIFSAIAMNLAEEVRHIVAADPDALNRKMSRFEDFRLPLHFAVKMNRPEMVSLLIEHGANPLATDGSGFPPAGYAMTPVVDRGINEALRAGGYVDLFSALALGDQFVAAEIVRSDPESISRGGVLHLMAKRGHVAAVRWLLDHGADANAKWPHWDAEVTALHLAVLGDHPDAVRALLEAGADPAIRDSKHNSDAIGWAEFFQRSEIAAMLKRSEP
jgi:ankyrin repeat protein